MDVEIYASCPAACCLFRAHCLAERIILPVLLNGVLENIVVAGNVGSTTILGPPLVATHIMRVGS